MLKWTFLLLSKNFFDGSFQSFFVTQSVHIYSVRNQLLVIPQKCFCRKFFDSNFQCTYVHICTHRGTIFFAVNLNVTKHILQLECTHLLYEEPNYFILVLYSSRKPFLLVFIVTRRWVFWYLRIQMKKREAYISK